MIRRLLMMALAVSALAMSGCVSVPMASKSADVQAKLFVPTADKATVYIYRNEILGSAIKMPLLIDGVSIGDTGPKTYVEQVLSPGTHVITSKSEKDATLTLATQAGQTYYVWQEVKMGMFTARSALHVVDEKSGREAVDECSLIEATNPPPLPARTEQMSVATAPATDPPPEVATAPVAAAATPAISAPAQAVVARTSDLASLDTRISPPMFNAAQNVAAAQQCDSMIHVLTVDGEHAVFSTQCTADRAPLRIECDGARCAPTQAQ